VIGVQLAGRRVRLSADGEQGFSLIELVITLTVMTILTMGVIPLVKVSVKRQKEQQLREALRQMRESIDQFHREAVRAPCMSTGGAGLSGQGQNQQQQGQQTLDPRVKVVISDCTIFGVDNPDRYPPDLETLVNGVNVIPFGAGLGQRGNLAVNATDAAQSDALATKKKVYLRAVPIDPMTGEKDWEFRSCYDAADASSWGGENVFDVRSKSKETALNGEKYSDW
jgi:general secretion pathway protein G